MPLTPSDLVATGGKRLLLARTEAGNFVATEDESDPDVVELRYSVAAMSVDESRDMLAHGDGRWLVELFVRRVKSWDLVDPDDPTKPFPLDADRIAAEVSADFVADALIAMTRDAGLGKAPATTAASSANGSSSG